MSETKLYKGKYIISIYDQYDDLVTVCDNAQQFAYLFGKNYDTAGSILSKLFNNKVHFFKHQEKLLKAFFIEN